VGALPDAADGLALVKPGVRAQAAYTLRAPTPRRKLNQNECPEDLPPELKRAVLEAAAAAPWNRYPEFVPSALIERLGTRYGWRAEGVVVGNGSNDLIQATLSVVLGPGDTVVAPAPRFPSTGCSPASSAPLSASAARPDFAYDPDRLIEAAVRAGPRRRAQLPNNPTGSALPDGAVERIVAETGRWCSATRPTRTSGEAQPFRSSAGARG
jgi:histidinol-phosphate/aromatic aminotransferase/cobyric acid decarboxylase-like protein